MENHEQVVNEAQTTEHVGVIGVPLCPVHERPETVDFDQSETPEHRIEAERQVEEIQWQQTEAVDVEGRRVHVMLTQFGGVRLQDALVQVARPEVECNVHDVDEIAEVVEAEPRD